MMVVEKVVVAAGAVVRDGKVLVARRARGAHLGGTWEFPGGKAQPGETPEETLRREVREEVGLDLDGASLSELLHLEHDYPTRRVEITWFLCAEVTGEPSSREGQVLRWVSAEELVELDVPAANVPVIRLLSGVLGDEPVIATSTEPVNERELKLRFAQEKDFRRALAASTLGELRDRVTLTSHYFDTVDLPLARRRAVLRLRLRERDGASDGDWTCGLKLGAESRPGFFESTELETALEPDVAREVLERPSRLYDLDVPFVRELERLFGRLELSMVGRVAVERTAKTARGETLEFDRLRFDGGGESWELEVETTDLDTLEGWLYHELDACGARVAPQRYTKLEQVLARQQDSLP